MISTRACSSRGHNSESNVPSGEGEDSETPLSQTKTFIQAQLRIHN